MSARPSLARPAVALLRRLGGSTRGRLPLPRLSDVHPDAARASRRWLGLSEIAVEEIVGSASMPAGTRRSDFLPTDDHAPADFRGRWNRLWSVWQQHGVPPIDVLKAGDGYWVLDGHNRVAMARVTGQEWIDAEVTEIFLPAERPESEARTYLQPRGEPAPLRSLISRAAVAVAAIATSPRSRRHDLYACRLFCPSDFGIRPASDD